MNYGEVKTTDRCQPAPPVTTAHVGKPPITKTQSALGNDKIMCYSTCRLCTDHSPTGGLSRARRHLTPTEQAEYIDSGLYQIWCIK
jgi:hypothetical protein